MWETPSAKPDVLWRDVNVPKYPHQISRAKFDALVRQGAAFIVKGGALSSPMSNWTCESLRRDPVFSKAEVTLHYGQHASGGTPTLGSAWEERVHPTGAREHDPKAPALGALYWGIKDLQFADAHRPKSWTAAMLRKIQAAR